MAPGLWPRRKDRDATGGSANPAFSSSFRRPINSRRSPAWVAKSSILKRSAGAFGLGLLALGIVALQHPRQGLALVFQAVGGKHQFQLFFSNFVAQSAHRTKFGVQRYLPGPPRPAGRRPTESTIAPHPPPPRARRSAFPGVAGQSVQGWPTPPPVPPPDLERRRL